MESINYNFFYCISNSKMENYLTIDKMYKAELTINPRYINLINDNGQMRRYDVNNRFLSIAQYRDLKINEILT